MTSFKRSILTAAVLAAFASSALANGIGNDNPPSQSSASQAQGQAQGQLQGQLQGQAQGQAQSARSYAGAASIAGAASKSSANVGVSASTGDSSSSSGAEGGAATSSGGDSSGQSVGGDHNKTVIVAFPQPVAGVQATIDGCMVAGNESAGIFFNMFSGAHTVLTLNQFCAMTALAKMADANGETAVAAKIRAKMYKTFADVE